MSVFTSCTGQSKDFDFSQQHLLIASNGDGASAEAADYLYDHILKRMGSESNLRVKRSDKSEDGFSEGTIYTEIVPDLAYDYEIRNEKKRLSIFGRDKQTIRCLTYMLIDHLSRFHAIEVSDLPPNYVDFGSNKVIFAMKYREPHLLPNLDDDYSGILHTHSIDRDWGIWGHNMAKVFVDGVPQNSKALVHGVRSDAQFCFGSKETLNAVRNHIINLYGYGEDGGTRFMITPNDNELVCTCDACKKHGNTEKSTSGAVFWLLDRLAGEFPKHSFFTTAYKTTFDVPANRMKENTGVFVSTIELPKSPVMDLSDRQTKIFVHAIQKWKGKTDNVYLWDYISNFDDYLTPFPVMRRVQSQIIFFDSLGIDGLFMNGSGYDYSPFDDVKTYVLSAMMIDPALSVSDLVQKYHERFYPVSATLLSSYLLDMEESTYSQNTDIGIYTSFLVASHSYYEHSKFVNLYGGLEELRHKMATEEKRKVDRLLTALSYTYLQDLYHQGIKENGVVGMFLGGDNLSLDTDSLLKRLKEYKKYEALSKYKEEGGSLKNYCFEWDQLLVTSFEPNRIKDLLVVSSDSGEPLEHDFLLCDDLPGFTSDFNQGWFLSSENFEVEAKEDVPVGHYRLSMHFLVHERHRMLSPHAVELLLNGAVRKRFSGSDFHTTGNVVMLDCPLDIGKNEALQIKIYKNKDVKNSVIACDEIRLQ